MFRDYFFYPKKGGDINTVNIMRDYRKNYFIPQRLCPNFTATLLHGATSEATVYVCRGALAQ